MGEAAQPGNVERLFPRVTEDFYTEYAALAAFVWSPGILGAFRRSDNSGESVFRHLMAAHREGFTAEIAGIRDKADYYREEVLAILSTNGDGAECWTAGARKLGFAVDGPELRRRFATEVVADSHVGLFLGQVKAGLKPLDRPLVHMQAISRLQRDLHLLTPEAERDLVDPMVASSGGADFRIEAARLFPRQRSYAMLALNKAHAEFASEIQKVDDTAKRLALIEKAVAAVEKVREAAPWCMDCYQFIGMLEHERAIMLANQQELRTAMEAIARASTYCGPAAVKDTRDQLNEILKALRERVAHIKAEMRLQPNSRLTSQGASLVNLSDNATKDADKWDRSDKAIEIEKLRDKAERAETRELAPARPGVTPLVEVKTIEKAPGAERFADWLASGQGRRVRWQIAGAALLVVLSACLFAWQGWAAWRVNAARDRAATMLAAGNDEAALDAFADFFGAARPLRFNRSIEPGMAASYRVTLSRWATKRAAAGGSMSDGDRGRINRYKRLIEDSSRFAAAGPQEVKQ